MGTGREWCLFCLFTYSNRYRGIPVRAVPIPVITVLISRNFSPLPPSSRGLNSNSNSSPYSITERRVPELIPVLGSQPAGDVSHKPGGRQPLLSARPAVILATLKRAATSFAAW